jgi:hypothetical protein
MLQYRARTAAVPPDFQVGANQSRGVLAGFLSQRIQHFTD